MRRHCERGYRPMCTLYFIVIYNIVIIMHSYIYIYIQQRPPFSLTFICVAVSVLTGLSSDILYVTWWFVYNVGVDMYLAVDTISSLYSLYYCSVYLMASFYSIFFHLLKSISANGEKKTIACNALIDRKLALHSFEQRNLCVP